MLHTLTLDSAANVHFTGWTSSTDFPLVDPVQATPGGGSDALVGTIAADLSALDFGSYVGGASSDFSRAVAVHTDGSVHLAGTTVSADFPTADPFQPTLAGGTDGFIVKLWEAATLPGDSLYVSLDAADTLGGLAVTPADIAVFDVNAATWTLLFDGSDAGLGDDANRDVDAVWFDVAGGALYLSSAGAFTLLDFDIAPQDVARCVVVTTGPDTTCNPAASGLVWRGADAGVTANVNAIEVGSATGDRLLIPALDALVP